jgi:hypothetical protein
MLAAVALASAAGTGARAETPLAQTPLAPTPLAQAPLAQIKVRTQIVRPPGQPGTTDKDTHSDDAAVTGTVAAPQLNAAPSAPPREVITDFSKLPPAVASTRARILAAARTGRIDALVAVMQAADMLPIFTLGDDKDPTAYWRRNYPDSQGVEVLAILVEILETGAVHVDAGTPEEMYVWPYFARVPLASLTPAQKVELFKFVTGGDYKDMLKAGAYNFFRLGIGQDGAWRFFVTGE